MSDPREPDTDASHGVHAAEREDGGPQGEPAPAAAVDEDWAGATETGGDAS